MYYKNHTHGAHLRISFWHLLMNFEKPKKSEFRKKEKKQTNNNNNNNNNNKNYWRYHPFTHVYQKPQFGAVPEIWSDTIFLSFRVIFCLSSSPFPNTPENQNFKKKKKASGDVIILKLCNKKHNQMMYAYSNMECDRHNFLPF